jgi:hypothetical protein
MSTEISNPNSCGSLPNSNANRYRQLKEGDKIGSLMVVKKIDES